MRSRVAQDGERVRVRRVARGQDLDCLAVRERESQVLHPAVGADEHGLLGELRTDRAGSIEPRRALGQLELGPVGQDDLHGA